MDLATRLVPRVEAHVPGSLLSASYAASISMQKVLFQKQREMTHLKDVMGVNMGRYGGEDMFWRIMEQRDKKKKREMVCN